MPALKSYSLFLGARNDPARGRFRAADELAVQRITAKHFPDGFTILEATGGWYDPAARRFRKEDSRQVLITTSRPAKLRAWCGDLGRALRQKQLLVVETGPARWFNPGRG
ncbi:MAG: hypothetical protein JWM88_297 [Verrucomicrobia bacterium]|nr:hypothetical protein [Verrucomicrobiota bacterium]